MTNLLNLSPEQLRKAASIKEQIDQLNGQLASLLGDGSAPVANPQRKRGTMSAEGRERIAAAQRARWAKQKKSGATAKPTVAQAKGASKMSPKAKAKLSARMKQIWAARKAKK